MVAVPGSAQGFVRYKTPAGIPFAWAQTCIPLTVYPNDLTELSPEQTTHAVTAAAAAWSADLNACTFLKIQVGSSTAATPTATLDGRNSVIFRSTSWCSPSDSPGTCSYAPESLAITTVFANLRDGRILEADVEVNAKNYIWADLTLEGAGAGKQDLQNAVTHELGHLIGLDNSCVSRKVLPVPLDNAGQPVPSCDTASPDVQATTMFDSNLPGDISKRTLAPDDIQGLCTIYPEASDPGMCPNADGVSDGGRADETAAVGLDGRADEADVGLDGPTDEAADVGLDGPADGASEVIADAGGPPDHEDADEGTADGAAKTMATSGGCGCDESRGGPRVVGILALAAVIVAGRRRRPRL